MIYSRNELPRRVLVTLIVIALLTFSHSSIRRSLAADSRKKESPDSQTFKVIVDLVTVNATVSDKQGAPIKNLTQDDFQVLEEGVPQKISVFKIQVLPGIAVPIVTKPGEAAAANPVAPLARKVILFVDDYHIQFANLYRIKKAGEKFLRDNLGPEDLVALITASGQHSTELTKYHEYVLASLNSLNPNIRTTGKGNNLAECPPLFDTQAFQISERGDLAGDPWTLAINDTIQCANLQNLQDAAAIAANIVRAHARQRVAEMSDDSKRALASLQTLLRRLRAIDGPKKVVFLSDGFLLLELTEQLEMAIDSATRSNTIIDSIDSLGLDATPPMGDASTPGLPVSGGDFGTRMRMASDDRSSREDPLNALAVDTGGKFYHNNNDLAVQMRSAVDEATFTYILGYYPTNTQRDGKFRKLAVKVNRPGVRVTARKGYYAPKGEAAFEAEKNADIREALESAQNFNDIPIALSLNVTHDNLPQAAVSVQTRIDVHKIHFQKREDRNRNTFTIVTIIYDASDHMLDGKETRIDFNLTDPNFKNVMQEGLVTQASFRLGPGSYKIRAVVRDAAETKLGSTTKAIEIQD
ncbi:MAG: VWA domain-containing protein [Acidobacteriia bacterium]|nr:VWA domain-containing protein [Terriglobia bacterium]